MQVDHVVPEALDDDPERLREVKRQLGLPDDFSVNSYPNCPPACGPCNRTKSGVPFDPAPIVLLRLREAGSKAPQVEAQVERAGRQAPLDRALASLLGAVGAACLGPDEWTSVLEFLAREGPALAEPLRLTPDLSVVPAGAGPDTGGNILAERAGLALVEDLHGELRAFRAEQAAASREILDRIDRLSDATHVLDGRPSLSAAVTGGRDRGPARRGRNASALDAARVREAFGAASVVLLGWPQETAGRWLSRPELDNLHAAVGDPDRRLT